MSTVCREFLGWEKTAVRSAAEHLVSAYEQQGLADLTNVTVVVPTRRAGRRLREVLLEEADGRGLAIFPPLIVTMGGFPELLYVAKRPFASAWVQQLAWVRALKDVTPDVRAAVVAEPPRSNDDPRWFELGILLLRQHVELTGHGLSFEAVSLHGSELDGFSDASRWNALAVLQKVYLQQLDELGLWDRPTARNYAVDHGECALNGDLVLLGTSDLSEVVKAMIGQLQGNVTALVYSDRALSDRFDDYGCVIPEAWESAQIKVQDHQIAVAEGPANQADAVICLIESLEGRFAAEEISIGVPDPSIVPLLEQKLGEFGIGARWGIGRPLGTSRPAQLLRMVADFLKYFRYEAFAELIRHSDMLEYLSAQGLRRDAVAELDRFFEQTLPDSIDPTGASMTLPTGAAMLLELLAPLFGESRSPAQWGNVVYEMLRSVYQHRDVNLDVAGDVAVVETVEQVADAVDELNALPAELTPRVSATMAILMILQRIDEGELPASSVDDGVEMVGWLDLPFDDSPVTIVTSVNDGILPSCANADAFLPNTLRKSLNLDDNAARYARDAYATTVLLNSRRVTRFVSARRQASNDPLRPSRLLLATSHERLAQRCLRLFGGPADYAPTSAFEPAHATSIDVPRPDQDFFHRVDALSVSDFSSYLSCPYRFYLSKVLRLRALHDRASGLDAALFGSVTHEVLERFGRSEFAQSSDADEIQLYLFQQLAQLSKAKFGASPLPVVQVQLAQMKARLSAFAEQQVAWRRQGWKILHCEHVEDEGCLVVDGQEARIKGRIDRIDCRESAGQMEFAILDYKTGDKGLTPQAKHLPKLRRGVSPDPDDWVDLQLPLYLGLLENVPEIAAHPNAHISLGYILLPSKPSDVKFAIADWGPEALASAKMAAERVIRNIRRGVYWPPTDPYPYASSDDYAPIVQHGIFGRREFAEDLVG